MFFDSTIFQLSARTRYVRAHGTSDRCGNAELVQSVAKRISALFGTRHKIAILSFIERDQIYVTAHALKQIFQLSRIVVGIVESAYQNVLYYDTSARFTEKRLSASMF